MQLAVKPAEVFGATGRGAGEAVCLEDEAAPQPVRVLISPPERMLDPVELLVGPLRAHVAGPLQMLDHDPPCLESFAPEDRAGQARSPTQPLELPGQQVLGVWFRMQAEGRH